MSVRKNYRLSDNAIEYLEHYAAAHKMNQTEALEHILKEHKILNETYAGIVADKVNENLNDTLTRIRLGVNNAERNTQIMLELWNTLLITNEIEALYPTDQHTALALQDAQKRVKERIANWRQKKLESKHKKIKDGETGLEP